IRMRHYPKFLRRFSHLRSTNNRPRDISMTFLRNEARKIYANVIGITLFLRESCGRGKVGPRGLVMRTRKLIPQPRLFELPKCESCDSRMWLLEIEAVGSDGDRRTFECIDCKRLMIEVVDHRLAIS